MLHYILFFFCKKVLWILEIIFPFQSKNKYESTIFRWCAKNYWNPSLNSEIICWVAVCLIFWRIQWVHIYVLICSACFYLPWLFELLSRQISFWLSEFEVIEGFWQIIFFILYYYTSNELYKLPTTYVLVLSHKKLTSRQHNLSIGFPFVIINLWVREKIICFQFRTEWTDRGV